MRVITCTLVRREADDTLLFCVTYGAPQSVPSSEELQLVAVSKSALRTGRAGRVLEASCWEAVRAWVLAGLAETAAGREYEVAIEGPVHVATSGADVN